MTDHPITPPQWQVDAWRKQALAMDADADVDAVFLKAARWGADQELEACCGWVMLAYGCHASAELRDNRRPKPPSLAEEALDAIDEEQADITLVNYKVIRAALERLQELENNG